jgi:endonuclease/exonuclease/phosphatase family metal-dependent hydrolase
VQSGSGSAQGVRNRFAVALALIASLFACTRTRPAVIPSGPAVLTVLTWNTHGGRGDLKRLIADLETGVLTGAAPRDYVLLLQEFPNRDKESVGSPKHALTLFASPVRGATGNAIVSTLPLEEPRTIDLPRERQPRAAVVAVIRVGAQALFVVSTHLENRLGWLRGLFGDRARGRQAEALIQALPPGLGIVGGDFNTMLGPDEPAWRALLKRFPDTPDRPEPTFRDRLVLDHLFFDLPDGWTVTRRVVDDQYGSDHHPVIAEVRQP